MEAFFLQHRRSLGKKEVHYRIYFDLFRLLLMFKEPNLLESRLASMTPMRRFDWRPD